MVDIARVANLQNQIEVARKRIGGVLVDNGKLRPADVANVLRQQEARSLRFGELAVKLKLVTEADVRAALAQQFSYPVVSDAGVLGRSLVAAFQPTSPWVEALRSLRSQLMLSYFTPSARRALPLVGVDESQALERLITNLAVVFAQAGLRTLLVDANLRAPSLHGFFGLGNRQGLADVLAERAELSLQAVTPLSSLYLLNGGTLAPNPQELLASTRYTTLLQQLNQQFDAVLINTPPLKQAADAQLIAARAGAALLVAKEHVTHLASLERAKNKLQEAGVRLLGVVLAR